MTEHKYISERFERRTCIKGTFKGKYVGLLDRERSDEIHERFFDLEILEGEITTSQSNLIKWYDNKEPGNLHIDDTFITRLPGEIIVSLKYFDGTLRHFKIRLQELKLIKCHLSNQQHEGNNVYGTIEGDVSGYLVHYDTLIKEIKEYERLVIPEPVISTPPPVRPRTPGEPTVPIPPGTVRPGNSCLGNFSFIFGLLVLVGVLIVIPHVFLPILIVFIGAFLVSRLFRWIAGKFNLQFAGKLIAILGLCLYIVTIIFMLNTYSKSREKDALIKTSEKEKRDAQLKIGNRQDSIHKEKNRTLIIQAEQFLKSKNFKQAIQVYSDLISQNQSKSDYYYKRAICYNHTGKIQEAVIDLKRAIELGNATARVLHDKINPVRKRQVGTITRCCDGTTSNATGQGACSHHGGVCDWNEPVYEEYRQYN